MLGMTRYCKLPASALALVLCVAACQVDPYETGDSRYSYLRADFAMLHGATNGTADYMLTDDGDSVAFAQRANVGWVSTPDSFYRALVYYDTSSRRVFSASQVSVVVPTVVADSAHIATDPLSIESVWVGGGYLNIGFAVKTGKADSIEARQQVGLVLEGVDMGSDGKPTVQLRVTHAQNGVPQYYSVRGYMSMPLANDMQGARFNLRANTYGGVVTFSR